VKKTHTHNRNLHLGIAHVNPQAQQLLLHGRYNLRQALDLALEAQRIDKIEVVILRAKIGPIDYL